MCSVNEASVDGFRNLVAIALDHQGTDWLSRNTVNTPRLIEDFHYQLSTRCIRIPNTLDSRLDGPKLASLLA
jgi:hypothetical protein